MQTIKRDRSRKFQVEQLESRQLLSWTPGTIPRAVNMPAARSDQPWISNGITVTGTAPTSNNPAVFSEFTFTAPRTGIYTIAVTDIGSGPHMADSFAIWQAPGNKYVGCYYPNPSDNIRATTTLYAGVRYEVGINAEQGYYAGSFRCTVTPPTLSALGSGLSSNKQFFTTATASLSGSTLTVTLTGDNSSLWTKYTHRVDIYLENAYGQAICSWLGQTVQTVGWPSGPTHKSYTAYYSLAGLNLSGLTSIYLAVWR